jgi:deoxyribonuclease-4
VLLGAHVSSSGGISKAIDRAEALGCDAVQVFTQSPRRWQPTLHAPEEVVRFRERRAEAGIGAVVCHAVYLVNLATPQDELYERSRTAVRATVETAGAIGAEGVVLHVGSHLGSGLERGLERAVPALRELLELPELAGERLWLLLENTAGAGGTIGRSLGELERIFDALERHPRLGLCIDSCHWYASGVDVGDPGALDAAVRELGARIGLERLRCLHVNDTKAPLASNRDRHASVGLGLLGERLGAFLAHPAFQALPAILETPGPDGHGPDAAELQRLRELHARWAKPAAARSR